MYEKIAVFLVGHRALVLVFLSVTALIGAALAPRLQYDFSPLGLFQSDDEMLTFAGEFKETFVYQENIILIVLQATGDQDTLTAPALRWQHQIAQRLLRVPRVQRSESIPTLRIPTVTGAVRPILRKEIIDRAEAERIRAVVDQQRLLRGTLISPDSRFAVVAAFVDPKCRDIEDLQALVSNIEKVLADVRAPPGFAWHLTGLPVIRQDIAHRLEVDLWQSIPLTIAIFFLLLCLIFRRPSGVVLPALAVAVGLAWTVGALVLLGQTLNILTYVLPQFLLIVGASNCVHVIGRFAEETENTPGEPIRAAERTTTHMAKACLLTSLTTAIGFLSLLAANSFVLNAFGWQAAGGVGLYFVAIICVFAALMPLFRAPRHSSVDGQGPRQASLVARAVAATADLTARRPWLAMLVSLLAVGGALFFARHVVIDSQVIEVYEPDHPVVRTLHLVEDHLGGIMPLEVSLEAGGDRMFEQPDTLWQVKALQDYATIQEPVIYTRSYVDLYRAVDKVLPGIKRLQSETLAATPETSKRLDKVRQRLERHARSLDYYAYMTRDGRRARVLLQIRERGSRESLVLIRQLEDKLDELFPPGGPITARLTGDGYVANVAINGFIRSLFYSLLGASVVIFAVVGLLFRSLRVGLISILPNMTPLLITLGYMGWRGYSMNTGNVIVFAISLGIAVDDTVHFIARFREEFVRDGDLLPAIRRTCLGTGGAIVLTSFLIVCGLSTLYLSEFLPTRRFAELTSVTMIAALVGDLVLLPACLALFWRGNRN